ncbi:hypothetical protein ACTIVE_8904 [Actinomadura verrucosospora]|uniref:Uncharacterized protein n=1 Tax=Actinomadura verrucosospora TaxID=46165 RepID=A0A7D3W6D9_ACTVE|nr:hypothetical protein ACTIVE_8904 [Actinomadura verrucosospora]
MAWETPASSARGPFGVPIRHR